METATRPKKCFIAISLLLLIGLSMAIGPCAVALAAHPPNCTRETGEHAEKGADLPEATKFNVISQTGEVLNFAGSRGIQYDHIVLEASPPLPSDFRATELEIHSIAPLMRIGADNLETTSLEPPAFSEPNIFDNYEQVSFNLCVDASGADPGTYTGKLLLNGPRGLAGLPLTQTAQLKTRSWEFGIFLFLVLVLTGAVLFWKARKEIAEATRSNRWTLIIGLLVSLVLAGVAMWTVYDKTTTWGVDTFNSVGALIGTAFTAAGLGSVAKSLAGRGADS